MARALTRAADHLDADAKRLDEYDQGEIGESQQIGRRRPNDPRRGSCDFESIEHAPSPMCNMATPWKRSTLTHRVETGEASEVGLSTYTNFAWVRRDIRSWCFCGVRSADEHLEPLAQSRELSSHLRASARACRAPRRL